jgi:prophage regulatory protein
MAKLLDWDGLRERGIMFSKTHANRLIKQGRFPKPVKLGYSTIAWVASEIDEYIANKIAERDAKCGAQPQMETAE